MPTTNPEGIKTVALHGLFVEPNEAGTPLQGTVTFTPSPSVITFPVQNVIIGGTETATLDGTGAFTIHLICTDTAGQNPDGWTYTVTVRLLGLTPYSYQIFLPYTDTSVTPVELADISPTITAPTYLPVTGPQGPPGIIQTVNGKTGISITLVPADLGAIATTEKGAASGVAALDASSHLVATQYDWSATAPVSVGTGAVGISTKPARSDHTHDGVDLTSGQTVGGIKTFSSIPLLPASDPTTANQAARKAYVDTGVASAVHLLGAETVAGVKTFSSSPVVPTPAGATDAANKGYVDGPSTFTGLKTFLNTSSTIVEAFLASGDTNNRFQVQINGIHSWGTGAAAVDTTLSRGGVGILNTTGAYQSTVAGTGSLGEIILVTGDANNRYQVAGDGKINWGPGNAVVDTNLYRSAVGTLKTDGAFTTGGALTIPGGTVTSIPWFNVKRYGAVGNGSTDDTTAIQSAITACQAAGGGTVYFPAGTYMVAPTASPALAITGPGVKLKGEGRRVSWIKKSANGITLAMSGPSTDTTSNTHVKYCSIEDLGFHGNSLTGLVLQLYYADNLVFRDVYISNNNDICIDTAEFWDSRFYNLTIESSGGAANASMPNINLRNSAATSGFGFSADSVNQIHFIGCRLENFFTGGLWIDQGVNNTNNPNGIYIVDQKIETSNMRGGPHLKVGAACTNVYVDRLYCFAGAFDAGYSTAQNIIVWSGQASVLENVLIANAGVATINSGVDLFSGAASTAVLRNVIGKYNTAPTGSHIYYEASSTAEFRIDNCYGSSGTQSGGTIPTKNWANPPFRVNAGTVSDASFIKTPTDGTLALDTTGSKIWVRLGGVWKSVAVA